MNTFKDIGTAPAPRIEGATVALDNREIVEAINGMARVLSAFKFTVDVPETIPPTIRVEPTPVVVETPVVVNAPVNVSPTPVHMTAVPPAVIVKVSLWPLAVPLWVGAALYAGFQAWAR